MEARRIVETYYEEATIPKTIREAMTIEDYNFLRDEAIDNLLKKFEPIIIHCLRMVYLEDIILFKDGKEITTNVHFGKYDELDARLLADKIIVALKEELKINKETIA